MSGLNDIPELDRAGLRRFGLVTGAIVAGLFGVLVPLWVHRGPVLVVWPWAVAGVLWVWALIAPSSLRLVYRNWMRIGLVLGFVNSRIILSVCYYLIFMPVGWLLRLTSKDPMARKLDPDAESYRVTRKPNPVERMERPY